MSESELHLVFFSYVVKAFHLCFLFLLHHFVFTKGSRFFSRIWLGLHNAYYVSVLFAELRKGMN